MERSAVGRSVLFVVLVISIVLTGQSTFGATTECRASPGPPAAQGMHWYYRVDRANNRNCWYLQSAGMQVRSREIIPLSKPRPQIVAKQSLAPSQEIDIQTSPAQPATAAGVVMEPSEPAMDAPSEAHFTARWPDLSASVDLGASDFAPPPTEYATEHALPHSDEPMLSTQVAPPDAISRLPHKSTTVIKFWSVFIAGAIRIIAFGGLLKLTRVLSSFLARPRLRSELGDGSEMSLSELMQALRRVDETFQATETRSYSPRKLFTSERTQKREHVDRRAHSAFPRLIRDYARTRRPVHL